jgi:molecular chaperone GrpE
MDMEAAQSAPDRASLARAVNELEAAKARVERDAKAVFDDTRKRLVGELLPVLDNVDRAIAAGQGPAAEGMQLVKRQLEGVLRGYGVERVEAGGQVFDPSVHEAVTTVPVADSAKHNRVIEQLEPGYRFGEQLLRPAKVIVGALAARAPEPEPDMPFFPPITRRAPQRDPFDVFRIPVRRRAW